MATLHEYFLRDARNLTLDTKHEIRDESGSALVEVISRLHMDFEARARYLSFYIPSSSTVACPSRIVLNAIQDILNKHDVLAHGSLYGDEPTDSRDLQFTGRIIIYSEDEIAEADRDYILSRCRELGQDVRFRMIDYAISRSEGEKPIAFISHDSRDSETIATPLAIEMAKRGFAVWFDEFQLKVGDSLRESIERGLKECPKCIFILTPNFLANGGWAKREYDSVFTRELVEKKNVILPVWHNVDRQNVYEYSPILADRYAVNWNLGIEKVASKLISAIQS